MGEFIVVGVTKAPSTDGTHEHVSDLCTQGAIHYTRRGVIESIEAGDRWRILTHGMDRGIRVIESRPHPGCTLGPYIQSNTHGMGTDNLENLPMR
jgi:hypothetical protein